MTQRASRTRPPIAIVGVSALFPGSTDATGFWRDILSGEDLLTDVPDTHWLPEDYYDEDPATPDKTYARRGGFLSEIDFDALQWGIPPSNIEATDTSQLLALIVAEQVLRDAADGQFDTMDRSRISCILGVTSAQELLGTMVSRMQRPVWRKSLREHGVPEDDVEAICDRIAGHYIPWQESSFPGLLGNVVAGRIANRLDLGGTNCVTDAACASTFSALSMAVNELYLGDSDLVISGGVDTLNDILMFMCFSKTPALSVEGDCRPFSDRADGTMLGEGLGMVALKRLDDAERDGNRIYAVLAGVGTSSDGRSKSVYAPVSEGQSRALRRAYEMAGFEPDTIELVEAHGTGTKAGDAAEFGGLSLAFDGASRPDSPWCALGSVKSQIGHTKAAAGAAGLFKAVMALHHKVLPPTIKVERPSSRLAIDDSPFYLNTEARPWIRGDDHPRRAGVSSFGFGGSNFHLALEEYHGRAPRANRLRTLPCELVALSGATGSEVAARARELAERAEVRGMLPYLAWECGQSYDTEARCRLALTATDESDLARKLVHLADRIDASPGAPIDDPDGSTYGVGSPEGGVAFLFPGQGSQYLGMGGELAMAFDAARGAWDRAASLDLGLPRRIDRVVFPPPTFTEEAENDAEELLRATEWAQPAIGLASLSMLALLRSFGVRPDAVAGHSFGEITALCAAGVLDDTELLRVARRRGELMAVASQVPAAMTAVFVGVDEADALLSRLGRTDVVVANHNAPDQVILSGTAEAIEAVEGHLAEDGARYRRLPVANAFHSPLVESSEAPFARFLAEATFSPARIPVWSGETAAVYEADATAQRRRLARQISRPVRFVDLIRSLASSGIHTFVEVGPGSVLTGLVERVLKGRPHRAVALDRRGADGVVSFSRAIARLVAAGHPVDLSAGWEGYGQPEDLSRRTPPRLTVPISGSNYGKLYPPPGGAGALPAPVVATVEPRRARDGEIARPSPAPAGPTPASETEIERPRPLAAAAPASATEIRETRPLAPVEIPMNAPADPAPMSDEWLAAWQEAMRQNAQAHTAFQQAMAQSHTAFLDTMQAGIAALAGLNGTTVPSVRSAIPVQPTSPVLASGAPAPNGQAATPPPMASAPPVAPASLEPARVESLPIEPAVATPEEPHREESPPAVDLPALLLDVVASKTGYPAEMLGLDMNLEGDLGIDSIKRVEILAAVQAQAPGMPDVDAAEMGKLATLREILEYVRARTSEAALAPAPASTPTADAGKTSPPEPAAQPTDLMELMRSVVAQKTGYPAEMLGLDMSLEGDLGIDSIKRVEILAAVQAQAPDMPEVDTARMGALKTLREIVDYLEGLVESGPRGVASAAASSPVLPAQEPVAESPRPSTGGAPVRTDLGRYALDLVPSPSTGPSGPVHRTTGPIFVTRCGDGLADALVAELHRRGVTAVAVESVPADAEAVVFLGGLAQLADADAAVAIGREAFAIARNLARSGTDERRRFVTVQDTGGAFGTTPFATERAYLAGLPALVKTAAQEWPRASVKAIDIARGDRDESALAVALADELSLGSDELEVGLGVDGRRVVPSVVEAAVPTGEPRIGRDDVVVVTGGGRGITASCVIELARATRARFLLLGRSALEPEPARCVEAGTATELRQTLLAEAKRVGQPPSLAEIDRQARAVLAGREVRRTLAAVDAVGGTARYHAVDVTDEESVRAVLAAVRADWGPVRALIHAAGVLADRRLADQTDAQFDQVFDTKVEGLRNLLTALAADPLQAICLFSSVSARRGNEGQAAYAMANEVLNKVAWAESRARGGSVLVRSLGWGPWEGGMVNPLIQARFEKRGVPTIPMDVGARMLVDELRDSRPGEVEIVLGGDPRDEVRSTDTRAVDRLAVAAASAGDRLAPGQPTPGIAPNGDMEGLLRADWPSNDA